VCQHLQRRPSPPCGHRCHCLPLNATLLVRSAHCVCHLVQCTAYHEGGHALCAMYTEGAIPLYKATIVPRGNALGMVVQLPEDDTNSATLKEYEARLVVCMGGRAAEERIYGKENTTSGASSDLEQATRIARAMVTRYGFSDKVGPIALDDESGSKLTEIADTEIRRLCSEALEKAHTLLRTHDREHHRLALALLEYETLDADEMAKVVRGEALA
jgi:ATP-dependent metalloprotease